MRGRRTGRRTGEHEYITDRHEEKMMDVSVSVDIKART
jgi:hypothetical protein